MFHRSLTILLFTATSATAQDVSLDACVASDPIANPDSTIALCGAAISTQPDDPDIRARALHQRGIAHRQAGNMDQSIADLTAVLEIDPDNTPTQRMLAWTFREMGEPVKAETLYTQILEADDHWQGWLSRCAVRTDLQRYEAAITDCAMVKERVIADTDVSTSYRESIMRDVLYFSSLSLNQLGRPAEAATLAGDGLTDQDISGRLYFMTLVGLWNSNQITQVDTMLTEGLSYYPQDVDLLYFQREWDKR